jgi:hypothetical protein
MMMMRCSFRARLKDGLSLPPLDYPTTHDVVTHTKFYLPTSRWACLSQFMFQISPFFFFIFYPRDLHGASPLVTSHSCNFFFLSVVNDFISCTSQCCSRKEKDGEKKCYEKKGNGTWSEKKGMEKETTECKEQEGNRVKGW